MNLFIKRKTGVDAKARYDVKKQDFVVLKGSKLSSKIANSAKFRGSETIAKKRAGVVDENNVLLKDIYFKSSSTAANFVTGYSCNGLEVWRDSKGIRLKDVLKGE